VVAGDVERRRLERNLHDGAQLHLLALAVKLSVAESLVGREEEQRALLATLKVEAQEALEGPRDLARSIYPPLLADHGLIAAIESQARKAPLPVDVCADGVGRYASEVEAAVYFSVLEALQNVAKYCERDERARRARGSTPVGRRSRSETRATASIPRRSCVGSASRADRPGRGAGRLPRRPVRARPGNRRKRTDSVPLGPLVSSRHGRVAWNRCRLPAAASRRSPSAPR
jgi:hypothetical protein